MKVLVVGSGGREHAMAWKISQSPMVSKIYCAPGNAGTSEVAENVDIDPCDLETMRTFAHVHRIDLTVVGPELPLSIGIVDYFQEDGLDIFGPDAKTSELESSKIFSKYMMKAYGIPTADYQEFHGYEDALNYIRKKNRPCVVKADGLASGKGVILCKTMAEAENAVISMMVDHKFGEAGRSIIIEELLEGEEISFMCFSDGKILLPMDSVQDYKPIYDGDLGPNTGGMGAYSPVPCFTYSLKEQVMSTIMYPLLQAMEKESRKFKGILYAGLMLTENGVKVLEFNVRFGDPETQPLLFRMKTDIMPILLSCVHGSLYQYRIDWKKESAVTVVMASEGYPYHSCSKNIHLDISLRKLKEADSNNNSIVFHMGTEFDHHGNIVGSGGRVLAPTAIGNNISDAIEQAYNVVENISWPGVQYRKDIGARSTILMTEGGE